MRVAFTLIGGKDWTGGTNYLLNLLRVLGRFQAQDLTPVIFADEALPQAARLELADIPGVEVVFSPVFSHAKRRVSLLQAIFLGRDSQLQQIFSSHGIDVVFEAAQFFGWRMGLPAIAWIPDFQHKVLPHLFPGLSWWRREIGFRFQVIAGRIIMLSSEDARGACLRHYPRTRGRTHAVPFAVLPGEAIAFEQARQVADAYELPEHFIFLPNQFWRHKNHQLVLDALGILRARGQRVVIAASGRQSDPRDPNYFPTLRARIVEEELSSEFRLLGMIPYPHIAALMRASSALLNPSLFEGWSTTVEEARSQGTPMILSDIEVHREQMGAHAVYFDRHSAEALADVLQAVLPQVSSERDVLAIAALQEAQRRVEAFARNFARMTSVAVQGS